MKYVHGFYFPDYDTHFPKMLDKSLKKEGILRYQWQARDFAVSICKNKNLALDIGANVGLWSSDLVKEFKQVIAFEPVTEFIECYKKNVLANNYTMHNVALGSAESFINMNIVEGNTGHSHIDTTSFGVGSIPLKTLDSFNLSGIDMIKIDVEGFEEEILAGAFDTIKRNKPVIVVEQQKHEYKDATEKTPSIEILTSWGYKVVNQFSKDWVLAT
jgi:FkbM family methyltransferase